MAGVAAGESVTIARRPERVAVARAFAAAVLGRQHPAGETAALLVSELVTNSVRHSASGLPGQTVTVTILSGGEVTQVRGGTGFASRRIATLPRRPNICSSKVS
jgi:anti-sigma regulatory factor (Ser/Thr protein kinase)